MSATSDYRTELIARLRATTDDLAWAVRGLPQQQYLWAPSADEWSIHQHVAHLVDMEAQVYLPLLRWASVPDMLDPVDYSRRSWQAERYDPAQELGEFVSELGRLRDEEFEVFRDLDDVTWTRLRRDTRWGPLTCRWIAEVVYRHALDHLQGVMGLRGDIHLAAVHPEVVVGATIGGNA